MNLRIAYAISLLLLISSVPGLCEENPDNQIKKELEETFTKKILIIRNFYSGNNLKYDSEGTLISGGPTGSWTIFGYFEPAEINLSATSITLKGKRIYWGYNQPNKKSQLSRCHDTTTIEFSRSSEQLTLPLILIPLNKVFMTNRETIADIVPPYWKKIILADFDIQKIPKADPQIKAADTNTHKNSTYPKIRSKTMQAYTAQARAASWEGEVLLRAIVHKDGSIKVQDILRPLGLGLDESAIATCEKWKFKPGTVDGEPVDVTVNIVIVFNSLINSY
jgi:TonB family protein